MSGKPGDISSAVTDALAERVRDVAGSTALVAFAALLAVTAWTACIAGLVALLAPVWGIATALLVVSLVTAVSAVAVLLWLQRRARQQRIRAKLRQSALRRQGQAALMATLPRLIRNRSGAVVIGAGLALGAVLIAALKAEDEV